MGERDKERSHGKWRYEEALTDRDVEEFVDLYVHRPLAFLFLKPFQHNLHFITPTHLTVASMVLGGIAGFSCYLAARNGPHWLAIGGVCMIASVLLDCADGMLARFRGEASWLGYMLDGFADHISGLAFWFGMCYGITSSWQEWWVWPANIAILMIIMMNVTLYDQFKNFYLIHARGAPLNRQYKSQEDQGRIERIITIYYENIYPKLFNSLGAGGTSAKSMSQSEFRSIFCLPMRTISLLGLGTHLAFFYLLSFIASFRPGFINAQSQLVLVAAMLMLTCFAVFRWYRTDRIQRA